MRPLILLVFLFMCGGSFSQNNKEAAGVNQTIINFFEGFSTQDITIIKKYSTPDFLLLEDAAVWTTDTINRRFEATKARGIRFTRINSFEFIKTEISGNMAWVAYHNTANISRGNKKVTVSCLKAMFLLNKGRIGRSG